MLRHAYGFALADQGADKRLIQDYLGHRNIQHTVRYTATNPPRSMAYNSAKCCSNGYLQQLIDTRAARV